MLLGGLLPLRAQPAGLEVITSGERKWQRLLQDIAGARQTIDLEYYLLADDASGRMIRDTHLRLEGPAVQQLEQVFLANWRLAGGEDIGGQPQHAAAASTSAF